MVVDTSAPETCQRLVLPAQFLKQLAYLHLAHLLRQLIVATEANLIRDLGIEVVKALHPDFLHHSLKVLVCVGEIFEHVRNIEIQKINYFSQKAA